MGVVLVWSKAALLFLRLALSPVQRISDAIEIPFVVLGLALSGYVGQLVGSVSAVVFPFAMMTALSIVAGVRLQLRQVPKVAIECGNSDEFRVVGARTGAQERPRLTLLKVRNLSSLEARRCRVQLVSVDPPLHSLELPRLLRWRGEGSLETDIPAHGSGFVVIAGAEGSAIEESWRIPTDQVVRIEVTAWAEGSRADLRQLTLEARDGWEWPSVADVSVAATP